MKLRLPTRTGEDHEVSSYMVFPFFFRVLEREAIIDFSGDPVIPEQAEEEPDAAMNSVQNMVVEKKSPVMVSWAIATLMFTLSLPAYPLCHSGLLHFRGCGVLLSIGTAEKTKVQRCGP